jgi:hypothetical protein
VRLSEEKEPAAVEVLSTSLAWTVTSVLKKSIGPTPLQAWVERD